MSTRRRRQDCFSIPEFFSSACCRLLLLIAVRPPISTIRCVLLYFSRATALPFPMVAPVPAQIPNLRPRPPAAPLRRRSLPLLTTHYPLSTLFFVSPLFSYSYELLFPQPLYLDNDPHCPPGVGVQASNLSPNSVPPRRCLPRPCRGGKSIVFRHLLPLSRLFALFSALPPFVFNRLQPLFAKYRGWGIPNATTGHS